MSVFFIFFLWYSAFVKRKKDLQTTLDSYEWRKKNTSGTTKRLEVFLHCIWLSKRQCGEESNAGCIFITLVCKLFCEFVTSQEHKKVPVRYHPAVSILILWGEKKRKMIEMQWHRGIWDYRLLLFFLMIFKEPVFFSTSISPLLAGREQHWS